MSLYEQVGLPDPPHMYLPNPEYPQYAALAERLHALIEADDDDGFKALIDLDRAAATKALTVRKTIDNPLYWNHVDAWEAYSKLVRRWRFRQARAFYLARLHPHVGAALGWVDPWTLGESRRRAELTLEERKRLWNALWGFLLSLGDEEDEPEGAPAP